MEVPDTQLVISDGFYRQTCKITDTAPEIISDIPCAYESLPDIKIF